MEVTRETEREKYSACYAIETYHLQGARLERVKQDIDGMAHGSTYLDVGCGRAEMISRAVDRGIGGMGVELVPELCGTQRSADGMEFEVIEGVVTELPFPDQHFDYVSCYDMLEHLPEEQVDQALDELFRVCGHTLFLTTNDKQSVLPLPGGGELELHLTRKPRPWWNDKIEKRATQRMMLVSESEYGRGEWHWMISR